MQADPNADVRGRMINAGIMIIDKHGKDNVSLLFPIFENYLNKKVVFLSEDICFQNHLSPLYSCYIDLRKFWLVFFLITIFR